MWRAHASIPEEPKVLWSVSGAQGPEFPPRNEVWLWYLWTDFLALQDFPHPLLQVCYL